MKRLYLMRHGHSPTTSESGVKSDALRPLSERGRADAARMASEIARRGAKPALILHSPLTRAVQTARAAAAALGVPAETFDLLDNTRPPGTVLDGLQERAPSIDDVLAIGHQPQIGEIAAMLTGQIFEIRPAGVVAVELASEAKLLWSLNVDELD